MGTIGVRCMFGTRVEEEIPGDYVWKDSRPRIGDWLLSIGGFEIHEKNYGDYIRALRGLSDQIGSTVEVSWRDQHTEADAHGQAFWFSVRLRGPIIDRWCGFSRNC